MKSDAHKERQLIAGLILDTEFCKRIEPLLKVRLLKTKESKRLAAWVLKYYRKYKKAPKKHIQDIYLSKIDKLDVDEAGMIEDTLDSLSKQFKKKGKINIEYLVNQTEKYLKKRQLQVLINEAQNELDNGSLTEAVSLTSNFKPIQLIKSNAVTPLDSYKRIQSAFDDQAQPLFSYGDTPLGNIVNHTLCKNNFVVFMAKNKGGKSWLLLDMSIRAINANRKVVFFQAGDMSLEQQERRIGIYLSQKSDRERYCGLLYVPVLDCVHNQTGTCDLKQRCSKVSPFAGYTPEQIRWETTEGRITIADFRETVNAYYNDHKPCNLCIRSPFPKVNRNFKGTIWYKKRPPITPIDAKSVYNLAKNKYRKHLNNMRVVTYPSDSLSISTVDTEIDLLHKEGFFPEICIIDYMELLEPDSDTKHMIPRDQENQKWKRTRKLSEHKNLLVLSVTQADAKSFDQSAVLNRSNFSEDKRKLDHVTDMFGINATEQELIKGVVRINSIVQREDQGGTIVHVLQSLQTGRPVLGNFY